MDTVKETNDSTLEAFSKKIVFLQNFNKESAQIDYFRMIITSFNNIKYQSYDVKIDHLNQISQLTDSLLQDLTTNNSLDIDSRLLCATSLFYVFLTEIHFRNLRMEILNVIIDILSFYDFENISNHKMKVNLCLIYGLCQTNFLKCNALCKTEAFRAIDCSMTFLQKSCMVYSEFSQMSFKILHMLLENIIESNLESTLNLNGLLYITVTNWESPITGVREYNSKIFGVVIKLLPNDMHEKLLEDLHFMKWNKAKFLMLVELLNKGFNGKFFTGNHFVESLLNSLCDPGLVTAGADVYRALLKSLKTLEQWKSLLLKCLIHFVVNKNMYSLRNLCNHWLPATIKQYPDAFVEIFHQLNEISESRLNVLYVCVTILKWRKKIGYADALDATEMSILKESLKHSSDDLRREAIQALCVWHKISTPSSEEYICVREFLTYNINSDCTALRQSLLSGLTTFLVRVRNSYFQKVENLNETEYADDLGNLKEFFRWLTTYLLGNMNGGGNYQRKVTSLSVLEAILYCFTEGVSEKNQSKLLNKSCGKNHGSKVLQYMDKQGCWNLSSEITVVAIINGLYSPSADIREKSSKILLTFFSKNSFFLNKIDNMFDNGKTLCSNQYFYESDCGQIIILLFSRVFVRHCLDSLNTARRIVSDIYGMCLENQKYQEQNNMLLAITNSKNYHGLLSALAVLILDNQSENVDRTFLAELHSFVETKVVKHNLSLFTRNAETAEGPASFAEMGECVDIIVIDSACYAAAPGRGSETQELLTDAHQIVLNCIWHNIKAGCDVCSAIISTLNYCHGSTNENLMKQCLNTIISVLKNCLHKGVIEAASSALGRSINDLTSSRNRHLAWNALDKFLREELIPPERDRNVTRRSAGLALCVRAFVINDNDKSKVLFHFVIKYLIDNLEQCRHDLEKMTEKTGCYNNDSQLETLLHLSCATVRDSSLAVHVMQYATQLLNLCFYFLKSDHWQIRNGALQLFGTLVPKLTGQKRMQDNDSVLMSPEELFSHFPKLWINVTETLSNAADGKNYLHHSDLVPVLSFLSSLAKRYTLNSTLLNFGGVSYDDVFLPIASLLGSPNYTVRCLSAVIIDKFFESEHVKKYILQCNLATLTENALHGVLLLLKRHMNENIQLKPYTTNTDYADFLKNVGCRYRPCIIQTICLEIEDSFRLNKCKIANNQSTILLNDKIQFQPYGYVLIETKLVQMIRENTASSFVDLLPSYLSYINKVNIISALESRILREDLEFNEVIKCIHIIFEYIAYGGKSKELFGILVRIIDANDEEQIDGALQTYDYASRLLNMLEKNTGCGDVYNDGMLLPLLMRLLNCNKLLFWKNVTYQIFTSRLLWSLCQAKNDLDKRLVATATIKYSLSWIEMFDKMCPEFRNNLLKSAIWLLQDEDVAVRRETTCLVSKIVEERSLNPTICLDYLLNCTLLSKLFHYNKEHVVNFLRDVASELSKEIIDEDKGLIKNPFGNESSNIYWEPTILKIRIETLLRDEGSLE